MLESVGTELCFDTEAMTLYELFERYVYKTLFYLRYVWETWDINSKDNIKLEVDV